MSKELLLPMIQLVVNAFASVGLAASPSLYLVRDGRAASTIVIPNQADSWTQEGAKWLVEYTAKATGANLNIVPERQAPEGTLISVGHTQLAERAGVRVDDLKWDGYRMVVKGDVLYLIGRDEQLLEGTGAKGTNRAVVGFLEDFCGVRWFLPTPQGESVPQTKDILVPKDLSKRFIPAFAYSDGRRPYGTGQPASFAHNTGTAAAVKAYRIGAHTFPVLVPADKYFDEHPEYFALMDGKRTKGNHLCTTNRDVWKILLKGVREKFDQGYQSFWLGQEDGYTPCRCPECQSLDRYEAGIWWGKGGEEYLHDKLKSNPCERLLLLFKWIAEKCKRSNPDKSLEILVYGPTFWPSKKFEEFGPTVRAVLCCIDPRLIEAWRGKVGGLSAYTYWGDTTGPMGVDVHATPREVAEKVRFLRDNGFVGIRHFWEANWGLQGPMFYELGKLMGNPGLDFQSLIAEYCEGVFGKKAGRTMVKFFEALYARHAEVLPPLDWHCRRDPSFVCKDISDMYLLVYPSQFLAQLDHLLSQAEAEAETERNRNWLRLTRDHFDFSRFISLMLHAYREYRANPTSTNRQAVKQWVDKFEQLRARVVNYDDDYVTNWFPGYEKFCNYITSDGGGEFEVYYVGWKTRKKAVLQRGLKGLAVGYNIGGFKRVIAEPITLQWDTPNMMLTR
ncbi:MAG: DUF4838 domain-containing protein [Planctomycetes bacterium]|nr:DUF4838 domain-containing protein [Planctomycetota bacterium]